MAKSKKQTEQDQQFGELLQDLQRTRADFENYRKRVEDEKIARFQAGQESMILKLLPLIDNIERAITHLPADLQDNAWAQGVVSLTKSLDKMLKELGVSRIQATSGTPFDPNLHNAISADEAEGQIEVIAEELQAGYAFNDLPIRHSLVRTTRHNQPTAKPVDGESVIEDD